MALIRIIQTCTDGCGRVRILKYEEGNPIPDYHHLIDETVAATSEASQQTAETAAFDIKINAAIDARLRLKGLIL